MSVTTSNYYGKIVISDEAIAAVAASAAIECYGVVDLVSKKLSDNFAEIFKNRYQKDKHKSDLFKFILIVFLIYY